MNNLSLMRDLASQAKLFVESYNPGDGRKYKVIQAGKSYFEVDGMFCSMKSGEIVAFLRGYLIGKSAVA